jgi:phosphatidylserine decarboxylase
MFHKEGTKTILFGLILQPQYYYYLTILLIPCGYRSYFKLVLLILVIILQFFRNPKKDFTTNENQILAPVDGKVVVIEEVYEGEYYKDKRLQISIFMSPINVHVTRYAISGIVKFSKYHPGKFWSHGIRKLVKKTNELPSLKTIRLGLFYTVKLPVH